MRYISGIQSEKCIQFHAVCPRWFENSIIYVWYQVQKEALSEHKFLKEHW